MAEFYFVNLKIYDRVLNRELKTPAGGLWKYLHRKGEIATAKAKNQAGYKTGALKRSIHMRHNTEPYGQSIWIGSSVKHAYLHHEGTKPHKITASGDGKLVFFSRKQLRVVAVRQVNHPGTKPNRYLSDQLREFRF